VPQFVRGGLRFDRWLNTEGLAPHDLPADTIGDLRTKGNQLSVFEITETVSAERIAIALAAAPEKKEPGHTAYAVFERAAVEGLGIPITKTRGNTIDDGANPLHYDLEVGTAGRLLQLAVVIANVPIVPITKQRVAELLKAGFEGGQLDHNRNKHLCTKVNAQIPKRAYAEGTEAGGGETGDEP
jgi:hypothetical protein